MNQPDVSARSTHDLWIDARNYRLEIARPTPTTIRLTIIRPNIVEVADGAVVLLSTKAISVINYPVDGTQYSPSTDLSAPADVIPNGSAVQVVGFYSNILGLPYPTGTVNPDGTTTTTIDITGATPGQVYYASIHAASNVLQYYPIGVQTYPSEDQFDTKDISTYTGNIPSLPSAPTSPSPGQVYYDQQLGFNQYWTGETWIPTRSDSILTGPIHPGVLGQTYLLGGSQLKTFDGVKWVTNDSTNTQLRVGTSWVPLKRVSANISAPRDPAIGDFYWDYTQERGFYWDGSLWQVPNATSVLFNTGNAMVQAFIRPIELEPMELPAPWLGQLFYNTTTKTLDAWNGSSWKQVNTDQQGTASSGKISIGDDGSYDQRVRLINVLKAQLGWPLVCAELTEEQFNIAIDNALDNFRMWTDGAYKRAFIMFPLLPEQQVYYLNSAADKTDSIVDVHKVHRLNTSALGAGSGQNAIWTSNMATAYYNAGSIDILSSHLMANLSEEYTRIFAGDITFLWDEASRELTLTRKIYNNEKVIIEATLERTEQELMQDRWSKQFIQNWAQAECKYYLGMIRTKFSSGTPGAAGTITLNGDLLIAEANQDFAELKQSVLDFEWGGHVGQGNVSFLQG